MRSPQKSLRLQFLILITLVSFILQSTAGKYQLQQEKAESALQKAQSDFDRLQAKFERAQNDTQRVRTEVLQLLHFFQALHHMHTYSYFTRRKMHVQ